MSEWREVPLGDVLTLQRGFDLPERERSDGPFPIVSSAGVTGRHSDYKVGPPGVVIGRYGSLGTVHWVREPFWPLNTALWVKDFKGNDERFVSYLLKTVTVDGSTASAVPGVNRNHLHQLTVRRPSLRSQRRIAAILSAFDELIQINERRIELLEDLARSLYREWFVRFRFPGHEGVEFVDSELGPIPAGWEVRRLGEIVSVLTRGISPKYAEEGHWLVVNQRCIRDQRVNLESARRSERSVPEAKRVRFGDALINSTGVGTLGRVAMYLQGDEAATADSHVTLVRSPSHEDQAWLAQHLLAREAELERMGRGSTGQTELSRDAVGALPLTVPPRWLRTAFDAAIRPLLVELPLLMEQSASLAVARNLLLPRLVTGRLDISAVDLGDLLPAEVA